MADERNNEIEETKIQGVNGPITGWLDGHTILVGLMAYPIRHTMSPTMHNNAFAKLGLNGAQMCDAVNTIVNDHGVLTGYTTDGMGWLRALNKDGQDVKGKVITLAGAGGAATPIAVTASLSGAKEIRIFNLDDDKWKQAVKNVDTINKETDCVATVHHLEDREDFKKSIAESDIYCDATSVGMNPLQDQTLVDDPSWFHEDMVVSDTVYAPRKTKLMEVAEKAGVKHIYNGIGMMIEQGAAAFKLWTGKGMPTDYIQEIMDQD